MKSNLICFLSALRFLTILPLPWFAHRDADFFTECVRYFAIVGLLIGAGASMLVFMLSPFLPLSLLSCVILLYLSGISGFLHLDGLADTADGFFSSRPKDRILEIMRDSRIGAMGVVALVVVLLFKFAALLSIPVQDLGSAVFCIPLAGRCSLVVTMAFLPYARSEGGLGKLYYMEKGWRIPLTAACIVLAVGLLVGFHLVVLIFCSLFATVFLFGFWCKRTIGGTTGDTLGAVCELTETVAAFLFAVFLNF